MSGTRETVFETLRPDGTTDQARVIGDVKGDGREGSILVTKDKQACIKCFRQDGSVDLDEKMHKLKEMLAPRFDGFRALVGKSTDARQLGGYSWPRFLAFDKALVSRANPQGFVGYGMQYLPDTHALTRLHASSSDLSRAVDLADRARVSAILALLFALAHGRSVLIGDARPGNVLIRHLGSRLWQVHLIDCDSVQFGVRGGRSRVFTTNVGHDEHSSPRLLNQVAANPQRGYAGLRRVVEDDIHALAVITFQTLLGGHHPLQTSGTQRSIALNAQERVFAYAGGDHAPRKLAPIGDYRALPANIRQLFENAFLRGDYATAATWMEHLDDWAKQLAIGQRPKAAARVAPVPSSPSGKGRPNTSLRDAIAQADPLQSGVAKTPPSVPPSKEGRWVAYAVMIALVAAAVGAWFVLRV